MRALQEKLKLPPNAAVFLRPGTAFKQPGQTAKAVSDNRVAEGLDADRKKLLHWPWAVDPDGQPDGVSVPPDTAVPHSVFRITPELKWTAVAPRSGSLRPDQERPLNFVPISTTCHRRSAHGSCER